MTSSRGLVLLCGVLVLGAGALWPGVPVARAALAFLGVLSITAALVRTGRTDGTNRTRRKRSRTRTRRISGAAAPGSVGSACNRDPGPDPGAPYVLLVGSTGSADAARGIGVVGRGLVAETIAGELVERLRVCVVRAGDELREHRTDSGVWIATAVGPVGVRAAVVLVPDASALPRRTGAVLTLDTAGCTIRAGPGEPPTPIVPALPLVPPLPPVQV